MICLGDAAGAAGEAAAVNEAVEAVEEAEKLAADAGKIISFATLKKLAECTKAIAERYPTVDEMAKAVKQLETDPNAEIPVIDVVSGTDQGDADAALITTLEAWDKWVLESDDQLAFAVDDGVKGASNYRLALHKHAINGKQLAQAQAQAIKAGQQ